MIKLKVLFLRAQKSHPWWHVIDKLKSHAGIVAIACMIELNAYTCINIVEKQREF